MYYGIVIAGGIFISAWFVEKVVQSRKKSSTVTLDNLWSALLWTLFFGLFGARVYHVLSFWDVYYSTHLVNILLIWQGGLGIIGGIIGGILGIFVYSKVRKVDFLELLDYISLGAPLAQSIGRWANFFNQEIYGKPTGLPWGIYIRPENRLYSVSSFSKFHPLFLYESLLNFILFLVLFGIFVKRRLNKGSIAFSYLVGYGLIRFFLEPVRIEAWSFNGISVALVMSAAMALSGFVLLVLGNKDRYVKQKGDRGKVKRGQRSGARG